MSLLNFDQFSKRYGAHLVLEIDSLDWTPGIHVLLGPNGSGKSTLLKSLAGLIPFKGKILLDDQWQLQKDRRQQGLLINYCEAEPVFPPFLRGNYLMEMYLRYKEGTIEQQDGLREHLGIGEYTEQKISSYSSGMKKKLALLLAFTGNPKLILLDEPFATLDQDAQAGLRSLINERVGKGCSFLLTTHQAFPQEIQADHFWHIQGRNILNGKPA